MSATLCPLGVLLDPLVGEFRQFALLDLLQRQFVRRHATAADVAVDGEFLAGLHAHNELIDALGDRTGTHRVHEVRYVDGLVVTGDLLDVHVHGHEVARHNRSIDVAQHGIGFAEAINLRVDLVVGHDRRRNRHAQVPLAGDRDFRSHLDVRFEDEDAFFFARGDVDLGLCDGVNQRVRHCVGVEVGYRLANGLTAQGRRAAQVSHEHVLGYLALAKSLDGDLLSEFLGRRIDGDVHLGLVDFDDKFDVILVESGGRCVHKSRQPTAASLGALRR